MLDRIGNAATSSPGRPGTCVNSWRASSPGLPVWSRPGGWPGASWPSRARGPAAFTLL